MNTLTRSSLLAALAALVVVGCGGGGGAAGGGGTPGPSEATVSLFATDNMNDAYDHVWVTLYGVDVVNRAGQTINAFRDDAGRTVDLKALRDGSGNRFLFLANSRLSSGEYASARVSLGRSLSIVRAGSTTGESRTFATTANDPSNPARSLVTADFPAPIHLGAANRTLTLDFDLSRWNDDGATVTPVVVNGPPVSDDSGRHESEDYHGQIAGLTGTTPTFRFNLVRGALSTPVVTDANTRIYNGNGAPNAILSPGGRVEVRGVFSASDQALKAATIKIESGVGSGEDPHQIKGAPSAINAAAGTFDASVRQAEGFLPSATSVHVVTGAPTLFFTNGGVRMTKDEFFAALATAPLVEVEGVYDPVSQTLTAAKAKLEDDHRGGGGDDRLVEVKGGASEINATSGRFTVTIVEYEGFIPSGTTIAIQTNSATRFRDKRNELARDAFFAALPAARRVKVEGSLQAGAMIAKSARIED